MTSLIPSGAAASFCALLLTWSPRIPLADEPKPQATQEIEDRAQAAFERGKLQYSLGEYAEAVISFRRAYELTHNPELLFNVAQAHRLAGDCHKALEVYRHFLYLSTDIELRKQAKAHVEALRPSCVSPARTSAPALATDAPAATTWPLGRIGLILGGAGVLVGLGAGAIYLWTSGRHDDWRAEDQRLAMATPGAPGIDERVRQNDSLARSIERWDRTTVATGIVAGALLATGATLFLMGSRPSTQIALRSLGSGLSMEGRF